MKKGMLLFLLVALTALRVQAGDGMWLPLLLKQLNEAEMKGLGMKMSAEDIYSVNKNSLKDAIVSFGGGCTGEVISGKGLVLTNHHCGESRIQSHSTLSKNYYADGFWAKSLAEELPNQGLFVTFIVRMEDVTKTVLENVEEEMPENLRQGNIERNIALLRNSAQRETWQEISVRPFFGGNQYFLFVTETYRDVRFVGAPPASIGSFGKDTDNWVWPRHTGDFSLFRIYADRNNRPAEYSPDNVPFQPRHFLPISLDGVEEGDFTLVFGFPGATNAYLPAVALQQTIEIVNPARIAVRDRTLGVYDKAMRADRQIRLQYVSKQARLANAWKKWMGEMQGLEAAGAVAKKREYEAEFQRRVMAHPEWKWRYGNVLAELEARYKDLAVYLQSNEYATEIGSRNIELFQLSNTLSGYVNVLENNGVEALKGRSDNLLKYLEGFYKDYRPEIDRQVFAELMALYMSKVQADLMPGIAIEQATEYGKDYNLWAAELYTGSMLNRGDLALQMVRVKPEDFISAVQKDPAYQLARAIVEVNAEKLAKPVGRIQQEINRLQRLYMEAQMTVFTEKRFFPDANSTLRVSYGQVSGSEPRDGIRYQPVTYLDGVMEKYKPGDYEFDVPAKLVQLYKNRDFGPYAAANGKMPVNFTGSNHTTGGNSGSPAIDAHGNLIGLNFDRQWEGTMSDLFYDPAICRNIMVDIRYVLFLVDKLGGAKHLIEEMKLVHPKSGK
ncbi:MAG: S46 family peptidase [Saprospiraceae bacterium]|nr:S46 family peptidase [Saprospiraceae bacterium]